jgi:protein-tyrosine phosphatase
MAEALFNHYVFNHIELRNQGLEARSAGILAFVGSPATKEVETVLRERDIDISGHRSDYISQEILRWADHILVMSKDHEEYISEYFPEYNYKLNLLTEFVGESGEIDDPIGCDVTIYRKYRDYLEYLIKKIFKEYSPS